MFLNHDALNRDDEISVDQSYNDDSQFQPNRETQKTVVLKRVQEIEDRLKSKQTKQFDEDKPDDNILQFEDMDDEDDEMEQQLIKPNVQNDQRQKILEQQKITLLKNNQASNVSSNQGFIKNLGSNQSSYYQNNDIDFEKIQRDTDNQYEPGGFQYQIEGGLPQLTRLEPPAKQHNMAPTLQQEQTQGVGVIVKKRTADQEEEESKQQPDMILIGSEDDEKGGLEQISQTPMTESKSTPDPDAIQQQLKSEVPTLPQAPIKKLPYPKALVLAPIIDMKQFLTSPSPKGGMIQCTIKRDKSGMSRIYPKYFMHLTAGFQFLMVAKKRAINNTSNYIVSMNRKDPEKKNHDFLGKVRSNFLGTEFTLYDSGENPKKSKSLARLELGVVLYESNILGAKGPRKMKVLIPLVDPETNSQTQFKPMSSKEGMLVDYRLGHTNKIMSLVNRQPKWNDVVQAFVLNFYGRVDKPSVKNFQLVDQASDDNIYLQFGRIGEDMFNLDFQWPLSPLQAFEIAISSFDYKIACE